MSFKIYKKLLSQSFQEMLTYKETAVFTIVFGLAFFSIEIFTGFILFQYTDNILGWSRDDYLLLISTATTVTYLYQTFFVVSHENIAETIIEGELDYTLIRPVNSFWFYTLYRVDYPSIVNLIVSIIAQGILLNRYNYGLTTFLLFIISILLATYLVFLLNQYAVSISFWKDKSSKFLAIPEYLLDFSSRPSPMYPNGIQFLLTWVVPILVAINFPVLIIKGEIRYSMMFWLIFVDVIGTFIALYIWKKGVLNYTSAN